MKYVSQLLTRAIATLVLLALCSTPLFADSRIIVRDVLGLSGITSSCSLLGCNVVRGLGDPGSQLFLVSTSAKPVTFIFNLLLQVGVKAAEIDQPTRVLGASAGPAPSYLNDRDPYNYYGTSVWHGYVAQPSMSIIRALQAQGGGALTGSGITVAVIDTGVDPTHPVLSGVLTSDAYDFTRNQNGANEKIDVSQSTVAVVDGSTPPALVNQSTVAVVDQSTVAVVDDSSKAAFGHGTMTAGIVHLVAPKAKIMALKAFNADGSGYASDVLRAIYYAQRDGAKVINMSFSFTTTSPELQNAINFVTGRGVVCVAAAGNDGTSALAYPAAYSNVIGVGSTTNNDVQSTFSNYGSQDVWVAAPGEGIMTTYPWGTYAAGWGTSFSAPYVSGTAALLASVSSSVSQSSAQTALGNAVFAGAGMDQGRIDAYNAVSSWRTTCGAH
jgi:subtilisin family serine protease